MEGVEGMIRNLQLSAAERKGLKIRATERNSSAVGVTTQALRKVLSEKLIHAEMVEQALGRVWCPIKGIECKPLGDNKFLISFLQESGKRKALEEGPWMISKELVVVADVDRRKTLDEIKFVFVPIWVRIMNLPIGLMNKEAGLTIGREIGSFVMVDLEDGVVPIRRFLRVRVRIDIRKPLMRGVTVTEGEGEPDRWCPLVYEYLPDFYYVCGIIGHTEKMCSIQLKDGEVPQFDKSLRFIPARGRSDGDGQRKSEIGRSGAWRPSLSWGRGSSGGSSGKWGSTGTRSDGPSWKRDSGHEGGLQRRRDGDDEVKSPLKSGIGSKALVVVGGKENNAKKGFRV